jgi:hypothetical protein
MGFRPQRVRHICLAEKLGVGSTKYTQMGDKVSKLDFDLDRLYDFQLSFGKKVKDLQRIVMRKGWEK